MKHLVLFWFLVGLSVSALAQEISMDTTYYTPPTERRPRLTADPDERANHHQLNRSADLYKTATDLTNSLREIQTWYVTAEGGFRSDAGALTNSLDGLVRTATQIKANGSALLGYTYRNAWSVEAGYAYAPIHLNITIANGQTPLIFDYKNSGHGIPLRLKRRIGLGSRAATGTGFWLTAGVWLIPNGNQPMNNFKLIGYNTRNRGTRTDTVRLTNSTVIVNRITGLAELGIDYSVRLSSFVELGTYIRNYWGLGQALRSDLMYTVNHASAQQATITADGTGWSFGIALRYVYGRQHEIK